MIAELRKLPRTGASVPAIALTGFGRDQDAAEALRAGFDAHLGKPVSLGALLAAIGSKLSGNSFATCVAQVRLQYWRPALETSDALYTHRQEKFGTCQTSYALDSAIADVGPSWPLAVRRERPNSVQHHHAPIFMAPYRPVLPSTLQTVSLMFWKTASRRIPDSFTDTLRLSARQPNVWRPRAKMFTSVLLCSELMTLTWLIELPRYRLLSDIPRQTNCKITLCDLHSATNGRIEFVVQCGAAMWPETGPPNEILPVARCFLIGAGLTHKTCDAAIFVVFQFVHMRGIAPNAIRRTLRIVRPGPSTVLQREPESARSSEDRSATSTTGTSLIPAAQSAAAT